MATSSIFVNIKIDTKKAAEIFEEALDRASNLPKRVPTSVVSPPLRDKDKIREIIEKGLEEKDE